MTDFIYSVLDGSLEIRARGAARMLTAFSKLIAGGLPVQDALVTSGLIGATGE